MDNQQNQNTNQPNNVPNDVTYIQNMGDGYYIISHNKPYKRKGWKIAIEVFFRALLILLPFLFVLLTVTGAIDW